MVQDAREAWCKLKFYKKAKGPNKSGFLIECPNMKKILCFPGSNSSTSINYQLLLAISPLINDRELTLIHLKDYQSVLYGIDEEKKTGFPNASIALKELIDAHDAFIISTAEHNSGLPVALKNALDWLSRMERKVFADKPVLLLSTSEGRRGAMTALSHLEVFMPRLGAKVVGIRSIPEFSKKVEAGKLIDQSLKLELEQSIKSLLSEI